MAYKHYTECIEPADYIPINRWLFMSVQALLAGGTGVAIALAAGEPHCLWIVAEITLLAFVISYCRHFLYFRLICLGGDRDAIGMIVSIEHPSKRVWYDMDTDYGINLLLCANPPGVEQAVAEQSQPYGFLIAPQPGPESLGLPTSGETATDRATGQEPAVLHVEFEGAGIWDLLLGAEVAFFVAVGALAACLFLPPWIAAAIALLALLIVLIATLYGRFDAGSPSDLDPAPGELHVNDEPNGGFGSGADIVFVRGTWVYDPLHDGWNELHPVKVCTKIGKWTGSWSGQCAADVVLRVGAAFDDAESDETRANQERAEHRWTVHPDVDGCAPEVVIL